MMLYKLLKADRYKLKGAPVWLAFLLMPVVPALLGTLNYMANIELLQSEWYSLWTQHTLFTCYFFLPVMLGIYCAYLMRLEHSNHNWNKVLTMPVPAYQIFISKLLTASFMLCASQIWIGILFVLSGKIAGLTAPVPIELTGWLACGTLGGIVMVSIQLCLSLAIKSFALPVGLSLAGGISGLVALAKGFGHVYPYALMAYGMKANAPQTMMDSGYLAFAAICLLYIVLFTVTGSLLLSRRDVK